MREKLAALGEKKAVYEALLIFDLCYILFLLIVYRPSVQNFILFCIPWLVQYELLWPKISALRKQEDGRCDRDWKMSWLVLFAYAIPLFLVTRVIPDFPRDLRLRSDFSMFLGALPLRDAFILYKFYRSSPANTPPSKKAAAD